LLAAACSDPPPSSPSADSRAPAASGSAANAPAAAASRPRFNFTDVAASAGLARVVHAGRPDKAHLLDSAGVGAAWFDYDGDGDVDAYVPNGWRLVDGAVAEKGKNALYRNRGDGTFEDATDAARVGGEGRWCAGATVADFDADGRPDLFVTAFGENLLYRNRGDGTFENVAAAAGVESPGWNTGAAFFDADRDGDLDLYLAAYIVNSMKDVLAATPTLDWKGVEKVAFGPFGMPGAADRFFRNEGGGKFVDATDAAGLTDVGLGFGFEVRPADFDDDGDVDVYVANDSDANFLYRNEGDGKFQDIGLWSGAGLDKNGAAQAGMGATVGDANGDGFLDIFVTNFAEDFSTLYRGDGKGMFDDVSIPSGVGPATFVSLSWGTALADLDSDGDLDLVVVNGHIYPQVKRRPELGQTYEQRALLLENDGKGVFTEVGAAAGPGFTTPRCGRGLAVADYDDDGDLDLLMTQLDGPPVLLRNDSPQGAWLIVTCDPNGKGPLIGTKISVTAGGRTQRRDVSSSDSYLSCHDSRAHFGLGKSEVADEVVVTWPDGVKKAIKSSPTRRMIVVKRP
jgi:enediyne biosynthesis protein E4